jgi:plastocyanin
LNRFLRLALAALALALVAAACGGSEKVGDDKAFQFDQQDAGAFGASTTAPVTTAPAGATQDTAATTTTARRATATTAPPEKQAVSVEVKILDASPYFVDNFVVIPIGGTIRFLNTGTGTYQVVADNGSFDSGPIAPGKAWIYEAKALGQFNYSDGTRPFAVGQFQVTG